MRFRVQGSGFRVQGLLLGPYDFRHAVVDNHGTDLRALDAEQNSAPAGFATVSRGPRAPGPLADTHGRSGCLLDDLKLKQSPQKPEKA